MSNNHKRKQEDINSSENESDDIEQNKKLAIYTMDYSSEEEENNDINIVNNSLDISYGILKNWDKLKKFHEKIKNVKDLILDFSFNDDEDENEEEEEEEEILKNFKVLANIISSNQKLKSLCLSDSKLYRNLRVFFYIMDSIGNNKSIQYLTLNRNILNEMELYFVSKKLENTNITGLDFENNHLDKEGFSKIFTENLANNKSIKHINLYGNNLGCIETQPMKFISQFIMTNDITSINLSDNNLGNSVIGLELLYNSFKDHRKIQNLFLDTNNLGNSPECIKYLSYIIRDNKSIQILSLRDNKLFQENDKDNRNQLINLFEEIQNSSNIIYLDLSYNNLGNVEIIYHLSEIIKKNKQIQKLTLNKCKLDSTASSLIGKALEFNKSIKTIALSRNKLFKKPLEYNKYDTNLITPSDIFEGLIKNTSIESLHIEYCLDKKSNNDHDLFLERLSEVIQNHSYIKHINISNNGLAKLSKKFLDSIANNNTINSLNLSGNKINYSNLDSLFESIGKNKSIQYIDLEDNHIEGLSKFTIDKLKSNHTLIKIRFRKKFYGILESFFITNYIPEESLDLLNDHFTRSHQIRQKPRNNYILLLSVLSKF
jgi:hypothetical protein